MENDTVGLYCAWGVGEPPNIGFAFPLGECAEADAFVAACGRADYWILGVPGALAAELDACDNGVAGYIAVVW